MVNLSAYDGSIWLAEPTRFRQIFASAALYGTCYTREQVLARHRADIELAKALPDQAMRGSGIHDPAEEGNYVPRFLDGSEIDITSKAMAEAPRAIRAVKGKVGVIPIHGPVDQRMSSGLMKAGGTSIEFIAAAFDVMLAKADIGAIVLNIDSPGGGTYGTEELADKIHHARGAKPIYAIADSMAASAAYWIASAADMVIMTPGGDVGSVGVYAVHVDESKALEQDGISVTMVSAGKHKVEYASVQPLSVEARANLQQSVAATYEKFIGALKRNRGTTLDHVRERYGQGRVMNAEQAMAAGMVDRVMSMEQLLHKLVGVSGSGASGSSHAEVDATVLRMRHEWRTRRVG